MIHKTAFNVINRKKFNKKPLKFETFEIKVHEKMCVKKFNAVLKELEYLEIRCLLLVILLLVCG